MSLPGFSIRRSVTTAMFFVGVILFGVISITFLSQELFPPIVYPKMTVVTHYANAAPEEIETLITKPIEEAVGSTPGLRGITSVSKEGLSLVIAEFGWNQSMDFAGLAVREKIDLIKARLPRDAEEPTVVKFNPFELPVITLSVSSNRRTPVQLKRFADKWVKDELEKIKGVASATISGGAEEEILVEVDQARLKASNLGILDVQKAISEANLNYPGGTIKENFYEYLVRTMGEFKHLDELKTVSVAREGDEPGAPQARDANEPSNQLVLLKDVSSVKRQTKKRTSFSRFNGRDNLTVSIQKQAQANTIQTVNKVKERLEQLKLEIPKDIKLDIIDNQATFIKQAINGVRDSAVQGGVLAFLVLLIFLRDLRSSSLIIVIIPITVLATFTLMYFTGISLNVISLGGVALGVGMLIDSAIVVIENVSRHSVISKSADIKRHALVGSEEVVAPLVASTLTTVMVFLPMIFITGIAGQIFKELAWVVVVTQLFSILVSLTLLPMLIVQFNPKTSKEDEERKKNFWIYRIVDILRKPLDWIESTYNWLLPFVLKYKWRVLFAVFLLFVFSLKMLAGYEKIVMPRVDQGKFNIQIDLPVGSRVERTNVITESIEEYLLQLPEVDIVSTIVGSSQGSSSKDIIQSIGSHQGRIIVILHKKRKIATRDLIARIQEDFKDPAWRLKIKDARLNFIAQESAFAVGGAGGMPIVINVKGNDLERIISIAQTVHDKIEALPGVAEVTNTIPEKAPETRIIVDKDKAAYYRLSVTDLATASHISIKGAVASKFKEEGKEIDIRVVLDDKYRDRVDELPFLQMHSTIGINVPLNEVVTFISGKGPSEIKRISQERTIQVMGRNQDRPLAEIVPEIEQIIKEMNLPKGYVATIAGESLEVKESFDSMRLALILSIVLVYMVMAAQFESYGQPFIIMFTVPLSLIGVSLGLGITHTAISVVVVLGIILLGGIVVNNGIILIDFINTSIEEGNEVYESVIEAGKVRLRPILMTAMTTILGLLPLAMGIGEGSKLQSPMAIAVMGGLLVATFLTLIVIPSIYYGVYQMRNKFSRKKKTA